MPVANVARYRPSRKSLILRGLDPVNGYIDVKGAIVTIDVVSYQKEIANKIADAKGDYVLAVKDNQPKLQSAIKKLFSYERQGDLVKTPHREHQTSETKTARASDA